MSQNHKIDAVRLKGDSRYQKLHSLHHFLEMQLKQLMKHPAADFAEVKVLKRRKLLVMDQMRQL